MPRDFLTDEDVEREIARLTATEAVKLARREQRIKYRRRQHLYNLRALEKRGLQMMADGVMMEALDIIEASIPVTEDDE